jgi:MFS family permease
MASASIANVLISMGGLSVWLLWPLLLTNVWGWSLLMTGLAITPAPLITGVGAVLSGRWAAVVGVRRLLLAGTASLLAANVWFVFRIDAEPNYLTGLLPGLILYGVGFALTMAPLNWAALSDVGQHRYGQANAAFNTVRNLAGALGIAVVVAVLGDGDAEQPIAPFDRAFSVLAVFAVLSLVVLAIAWPPEGRRAAEAI